MSKRYIDAELAEENIRKWLDIKPSELVPSICKKVEDIAVNAIRLTPAADVVEVRHGTWSRLSRHWDFECSICKIHFEYDTYYCPECGAKMDGERREENEG